MFSVNGLENSIIVEGNYSLGGLLGWNGAYITNCYFDTTTTVQTNGIGNDQNNPNVTGYSTNSSGTVQNNAGTDITQGDFKGDDDTTTDDDWDFTIWTMNDGEWPTLQSQP